MRYHQRKYQFIVFDELTFCRVAVHLSFQLLSDGQGLNVPAAHAMRSTPAFTGKWVTALLTTAAERNRILSRLK